MSNLPPAWDDDRIELLRDLWNKGFSASQIAAELACGFTRNAVIGKVHRLGLSGRIKPPAKPRRKPAPFKNPSEPLSIPEHQVEAVRISEPRLRKIPGPMLSHQSPPRPLPIVIPFPTYTPPEPARGQYLGRYAVLGLERDSCRWPIGDPRDANFRFCCAAQRPGSSYCLMHYTASRPAAAPVMAEAAE